MQAEKPASIEAAETATRTAPESESERSPKRPAERLDPRMRPYDPAGTRPKFDPNALSPSGPIAALPAGRPHGTGELRKLPEPVPGDSVERMPVPAAAASPPAHPRSQSFSPHTPRFQFMLGALGTLGVAAIALSVSLSLRPAAKPGPSWARWGPSGSGGDPAEQIAAHVAPEYTRAPGHQLVNVTGGPQAIAGQPVVVALRTSGSQPAALPEDGVFYQLCGEGPNCSIPGKASLQRGLLVRREALELALYTFHYIGGASQVIVTFPPPPPASSKSSTGSKGAGGAAKPAGASQSGSSSSSSSATSSSSPSSSSEAGSGSSTTSKAPSRVLLFRPQDIEAELSKPLGATLSSAAPTVTTVDATPEAKLVDQITGKLLYDSTLIPQQQSASAVLLLQPPSIGG